MAQLRSARTPQQGVYIDAVSGRHASTDVGLLLDRRGLTWRKDFGWTYDTQLVRKSDAALAGANARFSIPAVARGVRRGFVDVSSKVKSFLDDRALTSEQRA